MLIDEVVYFILVFFGEGGCGEGIGIFFVVKVISFLWIWGFEVYELY